jgi:hypothetical protein
MAVGCVPITASADYLTPSLEVGKNAVFLNDNFSELDRQTSCDVELKQMRQNVLDYFEQNLMPTSLAKRITSQPNHGRIVKFILNDYRIPR